MKKFLFLLISLFIINAFCETTEKTDEKKKIELDTSETLKKGDSKKGKIELDTSETFKKDGDKKKMELDTSETFKKDGDKKKLEFDSADTFKKDGDKKSLEFDIDATFENADKGKAEDIIKKLKESIKKDPETAKLLLAKANEFKKLSKEAKKYKDIATAKDCTKLSTSLKTLAKFHDGKKVSDKKLYQAYNDCRHLEKNLKKIKLRIDSAKRNTPQAIKIRKFQYSAKYYLKKAKKAKKEGKKAKAEYYTLCAKIKKKAADTYAKKPKIELASKKQIKKAKAKYNHDLMKESAVRFRKRAAEYRKEDYEEKAIYYDKAADFKEKLAKAYIKENKSLVKSLQKEYETLQSTKK
jgi:hypothetical protein